MKTIREWLNELPEPWRSSAIKQSSSSDLLKKWPTFLHALEDFNHWEETIEGHRKWEEVFDHYSDGLPMPEYPFEVIEDES